MGLSKLSFFLCIAGIWAVDVVSSDAPTPSIDCSSLVLNMVDCLSFVSNGSTMNKPEGTCCSGLKTVLKADAECLCEAFKNSAQFGVVLNVTKAMTLPSTCKVSVPPTTNCQLSVAPAPAVIPAEIAMAPSREVFPPAPAPTTVSSSSMISISAVSLAMCIFLAFFFSF